MARSAPAPGQAALPAPNAAAMFRRNATDPDRADRLAVRFGDQTWTHREFVTEAWRWANLLLAHQPVGAVERSSAEGAPRPRPTHVGVLMDNTPDYLFAFAGAAFAGATVVGLNPTRQGEHLLRDLTHTDVDLVVTEPAHLDDLAGLDLGDRPVVVTHRYEGDGVGRRSGDVDLDDALDAVGRDDPGLEPAVDTRWGLIFTSGTSGAPKAVVCTQRRLLVTGNRMVQLLDLGPDDVGYVCMPLFHSNAVMVGWAPSVVVGASVGLARKFSVSAWLPDVRRYGATWFNYTGKPLSYLVASDERPDDADNSLRIAFGNEGAPQVLDEFTRRFDVEVVDAFGSTEGGIAVNRDVEARDGSVGQAGETIQVVDEEANPCPPASLDADGRLANADECVGEIVNTAGAGPFEGYYNNAEATDRTLRNGWYWSGDLGYLDEDRYLYFAGRTAEWIRVDGENFPAGPIADALSRHPDVVVASAYGVPDVDAGDQVMAALVLREGAEFDPAALATWIDTEAGIGPKWRPQWIRLAQVLPTTGTNKIVTRTLARQKFRLDQLGEDELWRRTKGEAAYRRFMTDDEAALHRQFVASGRERFWDL
jgi:fatty-acyl-CoA synthase